MKEKKTLTVNGVHIKLLFYYVEHFIWAFGRKSFHSDIIEIGNDIENIYARTMAFHLLFIAVIAVNI